MVKIFKILKNLYPENRYIQFVVYLKSGDSIAFYKMAFQNEYPAEIINKTRDLLLKAKEEKEMITIDGDHYDVHKGKIEFSKSQVTIDGEEIVAVKSLIGRV